LHDAAIRTLDFRFKRGWKRSVADTMARTHQQS